eukprot:15050599-Ditylum_brightwellii.AAC.1
MSSTMKDIIMNGGRTSALEDEVTEVLMACTYVNGVVVSKDEEKNTSAWELSGRRISLISADIDSSSASH